MIKFPIAIQLYSVRDDMEKDFAGTIRKLKELGYDGVEFAGLFGKTAKEVKEICEEVGIVPLSAHVSFTDMFKNPDLLKVYAEIGCKYVVIPHFSLDKEKIGELVDGAKMLGQKAKSLGMKLCYHNHDFEFQKVNGEYLLDILYREVPADLLEAEIDTCWVNVGGENPADYVRKYSGRANILHLKDFAGKKSDNMYALIGVDDDKQNESKEFEFRPVGYGVQDFDEILQAADESGTKWVVVEQDEPSLDKSPIECAKLSIEYLKS